ncbi:UDP-3-O-acyl N-acetylglycosamine deacetylase family protein [Klebsormidium nitens]|uniref:UDP-3-O-acyl-N-acetylglucosamine deacetylase n=1 Tax=Klebsormidium nitens TaxID=105231 RepID=A0A1Y1I7V2_KLENI|nr:UDP-3-O-acyl N-acetylglycosamine deacetylase family protein [Klebsormidium nitens]|eukprot:GAQ87054.1 UDP-3-O-acyl N-acetylglycosamine deacetylase family protein [Klebsormidium nitens]
MLRPIGQIAAPLAQQYGTSITQRATGLQRTATAIWRSLQGGIQPVQYANGARCIKIKVGHSGKTFGLGRQQDCVAKQPKLRTFSQASAVTNESVVSQRDDDAGQVSGVQTTLAVSITRRGVGLHSGVESIVTLLPAPAGTGRSFIVEGSNQSSQEIPAHVDYVSDTRLSTAVRAGDCTVQTVEHLLSALQGLGVHNVRVQMTGGNEIPLLDGSASGWVAACKEAGIVPAVDGNGKHVERRSRTLKEVVTVREGDAWVAGFPSARPMLTYGIHFPQVPAIGGPHWYTYTPEEGPGTSFENDVAPARTFGVFEQFEQLRVAGLIKGGSLENALVCSISKGWLNPPLRFPNEPCRHKLLDLIGDLALAEVDGSGFPNAHVVAYKASHTLHVKFAKALLQKM